MPPGSSVPSTVGSALGPPRRGFLPFTLAERSDGVGDLPVLEGEVPDLACLVDGAGRMSTGVLATALDNVGGLTCGLAVLPGWIVTTNLSMRRAPSALSGRQGLGPVTVRAEVLRAGRSAAVARVTTTDAHGVEIASGFITCAVLEPEDGPPHIERPVRMTTETLTDDPDDALRLEDFFGVDDGPVPGEGRLVVTHERRNPWGILYGGGVVVLIEATAASAVTGAPVSQPVPDVVITDLVVHFLSPGRVGPVVATSERLGSSGRDELVRVDLHDSGADDRPLATAVVTVRRIDAGR